MVETLVATIATSALNAGAISVGTATAVTGAASAIGTGFSLLSGLGAVAGAIGQVQGGQQQALAMKTQANQDLLNARMEKVKAEDQANQLRRELISNMGTASATFASRGIGIGSGTPENAKAEGARNASKNIEKAMFGGEMAASDNITKAGQNRLDAKAAKKAGYFGGISSLAESKALKSLVSL